MFSRIIKTIAAPHYRQWITRQGYSLLSTRHRGYYAEMVFSKWCFDNDILAFRLDRNIDIEAQIPVKKLKKTQQKELRKLITVPFNFFCIEKNNKAFFAVVKLQTAALSPKERVGAALSAKTPVYLARVFEDAQMTLKKLDYLRENTGENNA